jgi:argininosuccinate lyase
MKLWGSRFEKDLADEALEFSASLSYDCRLCEYDIHGSIAHARMLGKQGIIPETEAAEIIRGLEEISSEIEAALSRDENPFDPNSEDIHTEIERRLTEKIGETAGRLHMARSRNDQVALDLRLYLRDACDETEDSLRGLQQVLVTQAEKHQENAAILPGCTHRQHAQPVLLAHHLLAYFWKFQRDRARIADCRRRINISPLGAAALAGTSFPIDPKQVADELGFDAAFENSMDAVSDRDFALEFLSAAAICMLHLSSLAGEIIHWSSPEVGFIRLDDTWCTGSSIMPQKRNPDIAELVNAKAGRVFGHLQALLCVLKGLPLTYNRDLQEDKEAVFDAHDTLSDCLWVMAEMLDSAEFQPARMQEAVEQSPFLAATEVADYLAKKGLPFRQAHSLAAKIVRYCEQSNKRLGDLSLEEWKTHSSLFEADILRLLAPAAVVEAKTSPGGTASPQVREALEKAKRVLEVES